MTDRPDARELIEIARAALAAEILPLLQGDQRLPGLMVANALGIAARELAGSPLPPLSVNIAELRAGRHDSDVVLYEALRADARARVAVSNPKYLES